MTYRARWAGQAQYSGKGTLMVSCSCADDLFTVINFAGLTKKSAPCPGWWGGCCKETFTLRAGGAAIAKGRFGMKSENLESEVFTSSHSLENLGSVLQP